ncbi:MAG: hypothetical protein GXW99_00790 [Clostridiales bacterium]|nr:hypothetical protein [Clostridiales bacterium]
MNEQDWLLLFQKNEISDKTPGQLSDFLYKEGYFDLMDAYLPQLPVRKIHSDRSDTYFPYLKTLAIGPLRALIAQVFDRITYHRGPALSDCRLFFIEAFYRMISLLALRPTVMDLYQSRCRSIPYEPGIYRIMVPPGAGPVFSPESALFACRSERLSDRAVLYIGTADGADGLRGELWKLVQYGRGIGTAPRGGDALWQLQNADRLPVEVEPCAACEIRAKQLLQLYCDKNGFLPLLNRCVP